jgi:hypothetical protein
MRLAKPIGDEQDTRTVEDILTAKTDKRKRVLMTSICLTNEAMVALGTAIAMIGEARERGLEVKP